MTQKAILIVLLAFAAPFAQAMMKSAETELDMIPALEVSKDDLLRAFKDMKGAHLQHSVYANLCKMSVLNAIGNYHSIGAHIDSTSDRGETPAGRVVRAFKKSQSEIASLVEGATSCGNFLQDLKNIELLIEGRASEFNFAKSIEAKKRFIGDTHNYLRVFRGLKAILIHYENIAHVKGLRDTFIMGQFVSDFLLTKALEKYPTAWEDPIENTPFIVHTEKSSK